MSGTDRGDGAAHDRGAQRRGPKRAGTLDAAARAGQGAQQRGHAH